LPHLWPTGSSSGQPPSTTARCFSSCPSDSTSRWTPCPPEYREMVASGSPWPVSSFRFRARLGCSIPSFLSGQRGITPAFGYGAPHPSAGGTSTLLSNTLLSAHYGAVRLLWSMPVRCAAIRLFGLVSILVGTRSSRDLPVLVHVVSQRARVLRLRRANQSLATVAISCVAFPVGDSVGVSGYSFSKLNRPAHRCPCLRFDCDLAAAVARLRVRMESLSPFL
jgi:hypothetical protein